MLGEARAVGLPFVEITTDPDNIASQRVITANGGEESVCGWCKDRYGLSWQITPKRLIEFMTQDGETASRAFRSMMTMRRIDIAALEKAVAGG